MPSTPNRAKSLSVAKEAANRRARERSRFNALVTQIALASMYNKLPAHLKKNKGKK
jgi:hypothetical protein